MHSAQTLSTIVRHQHRAVRFCLVVGVALLWCMMLAGQTAPLLAAPLAQTGAPILVGAGEIADCSSPATTAQATATGNLLDNIAGTIFTLGNHAYQSGTRREFTDCYEPAWGRHFARTQPVPGTRDYATAGAAGYYGYFGLAATPQESACQQDCQGYYSYNLEGWHIVALNSELAGAAAATQLAWLRDDLAANPKTCTLAYWHRPFFTSGPHQNDVTRSALKPYWATLYYYGADVVLNGADRHYERFAPQNPAGQPDPTRGIRQFVVGTGGAPLGAIATIAANSAVRNVTAHGVLQLTLHSTSYDWQFVPIAGQSFTDSGTANCVSAAPTVPAPIGYWRQEESNNGQTLNSATGKFDATYGPGVITTQPFPPDNNVGWNAATSAQNNRFSVSFTPSSPSFIEVAPNAAYSLTNAVTLAAWVYLANPALDQKIVGKLWLNFGPIVGQGYLLGVQNGQIKAEIYNSAQSQVVAQGGVINANQWTHLALTWQRNGDLIAYINGAQVITATAGALPIGNQCASGQGGCNVIIGGAPWSPLEHTPDGNIDEVMIFDQALSPDAVAQLAQRTFMVMSTAPTSGGCTGAVCPLETAIESANTSPNGAQRDRIHFKLPAPALIQPAAQLPTITEAVIIDGLSQPGASCNTWPPTLTVALDGAQTPSPQPAQSGAFGLWSNTSHVLVRGLNVRNFGATAILFELGGDGVIECNLVGTDLSGTVAAPNAEGIALYDGPHHQVVRNLIAGNTGDGLEVDGTAALSVQGNYIGTNVSGTAALPNGLGIRANDLPNSRLGAPTAAARNLIAGNQAGGIRLDRTDNTLVQGNIIGADVTGQVALGNGAFGLFLERSHNNTIGGKNAGNLIAFNQGAGVATDKNEFLLTASTDNLILENRIHHNSGLGIDLENDGVTANDQGDGDDGAHHRQNFPVLTGAVSSDGSTIISGTLNSLANSEFLIEFYTNDNNGPCQGQTFLGFDLVTTDNSGNVTFRTTLTNRVPTGKQIAATASSLRTLIPVSVIFPVETSEFSACIPVSVSGPVVTLSPFQTAVNEGAGNVSLTVNLTATASVPITVLYSTDAVLFPSPVNATPGSDYTAATNQTLVIPAGQRAATLQIPILNDGVSEQDERFSVTLALPADSSATLDSNNFTAVVTILDNDSANNTPPVANAQTVSLLIGSSRLITLTASDSDRDPLTFSLVTQPQNGSLSGVAPTLTYTPNPGFSGTDSFTFMVNDGKTDSDQATVTLLVTATNNGNTPPVANNQTVGLLTGASQPITLFGTDSDSDPLTYQIVTQPSNGALSGVPPELTYTPNPGFSGADSFTFTVNDGKADSAPATVTLRVTATGIPTSSQVYLPLITRE